MEEQIITFTILVKFMADNLNLVRFNKYKDSKFVLSMYNSPQILLDIVFETTVLSKSTTNE